LKSDGGVVYYKQINSQLLNGKSNHNI
jgi:hypothetical protein